MLLVVISPFCGVDKSTVNLVGGDWVQNKTVWQTFITDDAL